MKKSVIGLSLAVAAAATVSGCSTSAENRRTPDEFKVVRKAPLTIPPDYNLRPPAPGVTRPQELQPSEQARAALFGRDFGQEASDGERLLVSKAGGEVADPTIRSTVDFDATDTLRKSKGFSDSILFFKDEVKASETGDAPIDPDLEAERLRLEQEAIASTTGGGDVIIERKGNAGKLPGL